MAETYTVTVRMDKVDKNGVHVKGNGYELYAANKKQLNGVSFKLAKMMKSLSDSPPKGEMGPPADEQAVLHVFMRGTEGFKTNLQFEYFFKREKCVEALQAAVEKPVSALAKKLEKKKPKEKTKRKN